MQMLARPKEIATPSQVADYLILESRERGELLTNLKLQKLLYYAQAWHLVLYDGPIFLEDFRAWVHGPVLVSQYKRFHAFQWRPIAADISPPVGMPIYLREFLDQIIDEFGSETAPALELMTHRERPWLEARGDASPTARSNEIITKESMREYYRRL